MIGLSDFILEGRTSNSKKIDVSIKLSQDDWYELLNGMHFYYYNDDIDKDSKRNIAEIWKKLWQFGKDAGINIDPCYTKNGDIKKVDFDAGCDDYED